MAERLEADVDRYLQAAALNIAPPPLSSDPLVDGETPIEQLLRALGLAANSGDPEDVTDGAELHAQRDAWTTEAGGAFSGQDAAAAQQIPQLVSGIAGALTGAVTGLLQPLIGFPQQLAQSLAGHGDRPDPVPVEDPGFGTGAESAPDPIDFGPPSDPGPTDETPALPAVAPGPPAPASPATYPSASAGVPVARPATASPSPVAPMTALPMIPPAALPAGGFGAGAEPKPDSRADTKRIAVGPVTTSGKPGSKPGDVRSGSASSHHATER